MRVVIILVLLLSAWPLEAQDKKVIYRKTQNVSFDGANIEGAVRSPDGAYLVQKRGIRFLPLYKVKKQFDKNVKNSVEYLR